MTLAANHLWLGDNLEILRAQPDESADFIYIDPPFNTGKVQSRTRIKTVKDDSGDRVGFKGQRYRTIQLGKEGYSDKFDDFLGFLEPRLIEARRILNPTGSFFLHIDYREVHYCKVLLDGIFGRSSFINEIIWAYDYGARSKSRWSAKHDNILWYAKDPENYTYNLEACDRIPYMAPGLVTKEKAARGKTPTDVWWHTIVSPTGREKTGYPTQKPLGIIRRLIKVHTNPDDHVVDFFAGSGTTGVAALELGRSCTLIDESEKAVSVIKMRTSSWDFECHNCEHIDPAPRGKYKSPADISAMEAAQSRSPRGLGNVASKADQGTLPSPTSAFHRALASVMKERSLTTGGLSRASGVSFPSTQKVVAGALPKRATTVAGFQSVLGLDDNEMQELLRSSKDPKSNREPKPDVRSDTPRQSTQQDLFR